MQEFTTGVRQLVEAGQAARALFLLREAALADGHEALHALSDPAQVMPFIEGWDHIRRESAAAAANTGEPIEVNLTIVGRSPTSPDADQGLLMRTLRTTGGDFRVGVVPDHSHDAARLAGIEALFAYLRKPYGQDPAGPRAQVLSGWLIASMFVRSVIERARQDPLAEGVALILGPDITGHSRECGFDDLLPRFSCRVDAEAPAPDDAAAEMAREQRARNEDQFQRQWERNFAERREIHRMLGYFPFYRSAARKLLAAQWEHRLAMTCDIVGIERPRSLSWRMSRPELTRLLRAIAVEKQVPDPAAALDPVHTDRLHQTWLTRARAADFRFPAPLSLFELELAAALHRGGPWVQDRCERAAAYDPERR